MAEETETIRLEMERMKSERLKVYGKIVTVLITVALGTFGVAIINNSFQNRQLEQQRLLNEAQLQLQEKEADAERRQAEMEYLGKYLENALQKDISRRLRFAEYFAILTVSPDLQERWKVYHADMEAVLAEKQQLETELLEARQTGDSQTQKKLEGQLSILEIKLTRLEDPSSSSEFYARTPDQSDMKIHGGFTGDNEEDLERERLLLRWEIEFLNTLSQYVREDLSEEKQNEFRIHIRNIKLLLINRVWGPDWGDLEMFTLWVESGAAHPFPDGLADPAEYYRSGQRAEK